MSVETYSTSVEEIFQYLIQPLNNDASKTSSTWEEKSRTCSRGMAF